jgi:hypothetical protein
MKFPCLQEMPPTEPVEQGDEGDWDTMERQPPAAQGSTEPTTAAAEEATAVGVLDRQPTKGSTRSR